MKKKVVGNTIRIINIIITLAISNNLVAQNKTVVSYCGTYNLEVAGAFHELKLHNNSLFSYRFNSSFNYPTLRGRWQVKNGILRLSPFDLNRGKSNYTQNWCDFADTLNNIHIFFYDKMQKPINDFKEAKVWLNDDKPIFVQNSGFNEIIMDKTVLGESFHLNLSGYKGLTIKWKDKKGNCLHVLLVENVGKFPLKVEKMSIKDGVITLPNGGKLIRYQW